MNEKLFALSVVIGALVEKIECDSDSALDGAAALLCAAGAACGDPGLMAELIEAVAPIMIRHCDDLMREMNAPDK